MLLTFATANKNKIKEVELLLDDTFRIQSLEDIGCTEEVPETQKTIEGNAIQKATYVYEHYQTNCFSEDTGLEVEALNNEPGVYSARYAGPQRDSADNMAKVLAGLKDQPNRKARFKTVIALIIDGEVKTFEGIVNGTILTKQQGTDGFGYDPIFLPEGSDKSFAEMSREEKNQISHRGRALRKLIDYLRKYNA